MKIALAGDIAFTGLICSEKEKNQERFQFIRPILSGCDLVIANLEAPVKAGNEVNEYKSYIHYSDIVTTRSLLADLNIGCVSLANNHIYDCKMSGLKSTIQILDDLGIYHTGSGWTDNHISPVIIRSADTNIGFIACVDRNTHPGTDLFPELIMNYFQPDLLFSEIKTLRSKVDLIIVSIHWGVDFSCFPTKAQVELGRLLIEEGANIVMGHHTHTFQPFEKYKNGYIFYSLGGLIFGDYIKNGRLQALYRKSKKSAVVLWDTEDNSIQLYSTYELKGNYIIPGKVNMERRAKRKWKIWKIMNLNSFLHNIIRFNETVLYRIYEYFFGYYNNPLRRLMEINNLRKVKILFKEYKNSKNAS